MISAPNRLADSAPANADLVLVLANPRAGAASSKAAIARLVKAIGQKGLHALVITDLAELSAVAATAQADGRLRAVVAGGGDGTLAEVVNRTQPDMPLAVFPLGTANLLAGYLGLRAQPDEFAAMLATGQTVRLDAGRATWLDPQQTEEAAAGQGGAAAKKPARTAAIGDGAELAREVNEAAAPANQLASRIFLIVAGIGFDAAVVERLHRERTGHIRWWSYAKPIIESLRTYEYPVLRYQCAADAASTGAPPASQVARWLFVHNLPRYAGGLNFTPAAAGTDGLLDVCAFERGSLWNGLKYASRVWLGNHQRAADCRMLRTTRLRISADVPVPVELDGDPGGQLPVEIETLPARVRLIVPPAALARLA
jgi:diacylglycerol kinase family enzyme